ncbi:MAG TPA: DUF4268 domain-containing protein [Candidatus Dormibacteraeota bacterium]|nr:DUF4268 domain-containing protein [Candidatus Dormibacteraeota bacterium]
MKLTRIEVTNYRSLFADSSNRVFSVELADGMNALIGPNNCGKSNVLRAVALALDPTFPFDRRRDWPATLTWARPRVTLEFRCDPRRPPERTLLKYAHEYELNANGGRPETYAAANTIRLTVYYTGQEDQGTADGSGRHETLYARGAGAREGETELRDRALAQLRRCVRFVLIESGQSLESLLAGKFREILHTVLKEHLKTKLEAADRHRNGYVKELQDELLDPLRSRVLEVVSGLFPEVRAVSLVPNVPDIDRTLSDVAVNVTDRIATSLAEKGTGMRGAVLVAMLRYMADQTRRSMVFALEEPEAFLHPGAQEALRDDLEKLGERPDVTVLITTHSPFVISRDGRARVIALTKGTEGRTRIAGSARGEEPHAGLLGGLFRSTVLADILDGPGRVPARARGILVVEGVTDEGFIEQAASRLGRPDLIDDLFISPAGGTERVILQATMMKLQAQRPIVVLLDADENGMAARRLLKEKLGFDDRRELLTYADIVGQIGSGTEAEDLFPWTLIDRFVQEKGEGLVMKSKTRRADGGWRYDLNGAGKEEIVDFISQRAKPADFEQWRRLIETVRHRMGLDSSPVEALAPTSAVPIATASGKRELYRLFWDKLISKIRREFPGWSAVRKPRPQNGMRFLSTPALSGVLLSVSFQVGGKISVELDIDTPDAAYNARLFDALQARKGEIEAAYGRTLTWESKVGVRYRRIADRTDGDVRRLDEHDRYVDWCLDSIRRWQRALSTLPPAMNSPQAPAEKGSARAPGPEDRLEPAGGGGPNQASSA